MPNYFEFEVALCEIRPRIWRRFLLRNTAVFYELHKAIHDSCGWWNYHLFVFRDANKRDPKVLAAIPSDEDLECYGMPVPDARRRKLSSYFGEGKADSALYEYDFGDGWQHEVKLVRMVEEAGTFKRRLLAGERAFPHEDCGGIGGYLRCVEFLKTGKDSLEDDPEGLRTWLGGWEPERFDLAETRKYFDTGRHAPIPGEPNQA